MRSTLLDVLRLVFFITVPSAVGLFLLREPILGLLLQGGNFDAGSRAMTAHALEFHVLGLCFVGLSRGLLSGFHALKDVATPVRLAAVNMVVNVILAWWLSAGSLGFAGVALASSIAAALHVFFLALAMRRKVEELPLGKLRAPAAKTLLAAAVMGLAVWSARGVLSPDLGKAALGAALFAVILGAALLFFAVAWILGMPEAKWLLRKRRIKTG